MGIRTHSTEPLETVKPEWGFLRHVQATADNRSCVLVLDVLEKGDDGLHGRQRIAFRGEVAAETVGPLDLLRWSLSFDGTKLAVARDNRYRGGTGHTVLVNGEPFYECPYDVIHYFDWITNDALAWEAWDDERIKDDGIHYFVNGGEQTGLFSFQPVLLDRQHTAVVLTHGDQECTVFDDGTRTPHRPKREPWDHDPDAPRPERAEERWSEDRRSVTVAYRGETGPAFDAIENDHGMRTFAYRDDRSKVAYVGIRYSGFAKKLGSFVGKSFERFDRSTDKRGKEPWWGWPIALLFNPYFGIGTAFIETSRRYFPVNGDKPWKKGYRYAHDHFFTPGGELVVTCSEGRGVRVVIDEDEGPLFDQVWNVRCLKDGRVCYLARYADQIVRVTVDR